MGKNGYYIKIPHILNLSYSTHFYPFLILYYTQIVTSILLIGDINVSYYHIGNINVSNFDIVLIFTHF